MTVFLNNKNVPKVNLTELWIAASQSKKNQGGIGEPGNRILIDSKNKDMVETFLKQSVNVQDFSQSYFSTASSEPKSLLIIYQGHTFLHKWIKKILRWLN